MDRARVTELHFMTPMVNLESILEHGIVSHERCGRLRHTSIADEDVQTLRSRIRVPGGLRLHQYANLYFDARNAMMFRVRSYDLVVLRVDPAVLDLDDAVIADGNAARFPPTRFFPSPDGLEYLDEDRVYATWWTHEDPWEKRERKRQRQAELLVPDVVHPDYIFGCYTWRKDEAAHCQELDEWLVEVNARVYF